MGACHCGAISFTADIDPSRVMVCRCTDCQVMSGSPFRAIVVAPIGTFSLRGTPRSYDKSQVQEMVRRLLALPASPGCDAADALGLAISHAHAGASFAALATATPLQRRQHAQYRKGRTY